MIRVGAIGHGDIAQRRHFPDLIDLGDRALLVAVAGRDPSRVEQVADRFGVPSWHSDIGEMLARDDIDAVMVLTPPSSHRDLVTQAIEAGKHVLVEKPLVPTLEDATQLLTTLEAQHELSPITFLPLPDVDTPEHRLVARLIAEDIVGEVTSVECHRGHSGPTHADWFYRPDLAGGGALIDLGIYAVTAVTSLLGPARTVTAQLSRHFDTRTMDDGTVIRPDVEDSALVSLLLENNLAVSVNANWNGYAGHHATRSRTTVIGREGSLQFGLADGCVYVNRADGDYARLTVPSVPADFDGGPSRRIAASTTAPRDSVVDHFVGLIEAGETSARRLEIQVHVMEILLEAYRSEWGDDLRTLETRF
jgi:predicted dehydrogenase